MGLKALIGVMVIVLGVAIAAQADPLESEGMFFTGGSILTMVNLQPTIELIEYQPVAVEPTQWSETTFNTYSLICTMVYFQPTFELIQYVPEYSFIINSGSIFQIPTPLAVAPVPAALLLFGPGLLGLILWRRNHS